MKNKFTSSMVKLNGKLRQESSPVGIAIQVVKNITTSTFDSHISELTTKLDTLELTDKDGKPQGSGWSRISIDQFCVDIYQTNSRASHYKEIPTKFKNSMFGFVNIQKY